MINVFFLILALMFSSYSSALGTGNSVNIFETSKIDSTTEEENTRKYIKGLQLLDAKTPMDLNYNNKVRPFIESYVGRNKELISRMHALKELYFPLFEQELDKYNLPLELKYLAIVESALNPKAKSFSGATGLWQFMYLTGREYGLKVTSYIDERQDPLKSTQAACEYFQKLYTMFGDWNLVLAAYNGGPGYLQSKINSVGSYDFWKLHPYLRKETRNYVPTFIAVNYAMNYSFEHNILPDTLSVDFGKTDTIKIKQQVDISTLSEILCLKKSTIRYFNPSYKKDVFPKNSILILPVFAVLDFLYNEEANYHFIDLVEKKEILIDEERVLYIVKEGDYLGRIAKEFGVKVFELKKWNNLRNTNLDIGDKLVVYIKKNQPSKSKKPKNEYTVQKGDTLWGIAQKFKGISVWKIKSLNNLESDNLQPGVKIILPAI